MRAEARACELCKQPASLYCDPDSAFLCHSCDAAVHQANFLVARHLRHPLCSRCSSLCPSCFSGTGIRAPKRTFCSSCSPESFSNDLTYPCMSLPSSSLSATSSGCISSAESSAAPAPAVKKIGSGRKRRTNGVRASSSSAVEVSVRKSNRRAAAPGNRGAVRQRSTAGIISVKSEGVIVNWCNGLGLGPNFAAPVSRRAFLALSLAESWPLPLRVSIAASLWLALRFCGVREMATGEILRRLESVSGVPGKLILATTAKLASAAWSKKARPDDPEEGWAESSV